MQVDSRHQIQRWIALCWLSLATLPLGLLAIGGGPCAGPRNIAGSAILLVVGLVAVVAPAYGVFRMLQLFRMAPVGEKLLGVMSVLCACFVVLVGGFYFLIGVLSLRAFVS